MRKDKTSYRSIRFLTYIGLHRILTSRPSTHILRQHPRQFLNLTVGHLWEGRPIAVMKAGKAVIIIGCNKGEIVSHKLSRTEHEK